MGVFFKEGNFSTIFDSAGFLKNKIVDNAYNAHYNVIKLAGRRDALNE